MRQLEEDERVLIRGHVTGSPVDARTSTNSSAIWFVIDVADRPSRQPDDRRTAALRQSKTNCRCVPARAQRRDEDERHRGDAGGRAEPEQEQQPAVVGDALDVRPPFLRSGGEPRERKRARTITTTLLQTGAYAAAANRRRALRTAVASAVKP